MSNDTQVAAHMALWKVARDAFDDYWHEDSKGIDSEAWAQAAQAVVSAITNQPACDEYFKARPQLDSAVNRGIFQAGSCAAVEASARQLAEQPGFVMTLASLQQAHVERQEQWCPEQKPDLSFRGNELGGECGEAQNVIKKLERERHGWRGSRDTVEHLGQELADVVHCAVLCAITAGIDLERAVIDKFNATSEKNGLDCRLTAARPLAASPTAPTAVEPDERLTNQGVPLTQAQIEAAAQHTNFWGMTLGEIFADGVRFAEGMHGIRAASASKGTPL